MSYSRPTVDVYLRNVVSIGLFCRPVVAKNPNFLPFFAVFGLRHLVMSPIIVINLRKLSTGAQYKPSPIQRYQNRFCTPNAFMTKSGAQTLTFRSVTHKGRQTGRQKNSTFLATPAADEIRAPPKLLGMVLEDLEHVLAPLKRLRV